MSYKEKLAKVTTFIFDIDGVLTNGDVHVLKGGTSRTFNSRDGFAIQFAKRQGFKVFVISGGSSHHVKTRLLRSGVTEVVMTALNKLDEYNGLKIRHQFKDEEALYMGDDIPDYNAMKSAGIAACPADAATEIKEISDYVSPFNGGRHCVRDIIEQTLRVQDKWFKPEA